jgi:hypothetical protein
MNRLLYKFGRILINSNRMFYMYDPKEIHSVNEILKNIKIIDDVSKKNNDDGGGYITSVNTDCIDGCDGGGGDDGGDGGGGSD